MISSINGFYLYFHTFTSPFTNFSPFTNQYIWVHNEIKWSALLHFTSCDDLLQYFFLLLFFSFCSSFFSFFFQVFHLIYSNRCLCRENMLTKNPLCMGYLLKYELYRGIIENIHIYLNLSSYKNDKSKNKSESNMVRFIDYLITF